MINLSLNDYRFFHKSTKLKSTPVGLYEQLYRDRKNSFVYESLEEAGRKGRYSFIGSDPFLTISSIRDRIEIIFQDKVFKENGNPLEMIRKIISDRKEYPSVCPFPGGALGYLGYDAIRYFENIPDENQDGIETPDLFFMFPGEILIFDHEKELINIVIYSLDNADSRINHIINIIDMDPAESDLIMPDSNEKEVDFQSNIEKGEFEKKVKRAKEYINAGDIFQVVLSQRLSFILKNDQFTVYRLLRRMNPSPYMYFLDLDDYSILGSSPEILVKCTDGEIVSRPLAGTRPRGKNDSEDKRLEKELLNDEKERAEHVMLVDLARNDLGRVCKTGSVHTDQFMDVERFARVMHIVSNVKGSLMNNKDCIDLLKAAFPAGTVSGAPKIRAMEIIDELEPIRRGIYSGSIGYFGFDGNMDMCIAIRMIVVKGRQGFIQAGAGIVADSVPENEYFETLNKAKALLQALQ